MSNTNRPVLHSKSQKSSSSGIQGKLQPKRVQSLQLQSDRQSKQESLGAIEELIQCGICLEKLKQPRMLPCQHTFCMSCLQTHLLAMHLVNHKHGTNEKPKTMAGEADSMMCPTCSTKINLVKGFDSIEELPRNVYIDSLLKLVDGNVTPPVQKTIDFRCVKCQTVSENQEQYCKHCLQIFCNICWNEHLSALESNFAILSKQLDESKIQLECKLENFENRCDQLQEKVKEATQQKINEFLQMERDTLKDVKSIKLQSRRDCDNINQKIDHLRKQLTSQNSYSEDKVATFLSLHRQTSRLLDKVNHYGETRLIFDHENFKLDQDTEGIYNDIEVHETINGARINNPLESVEAMANYYKARTFAPKLIWNKCPRPASAAIPPWDSTSIYICGTDSHCVLILNKDPTKVVGRLTSPQMLCPNGLAFSDKHKEIYISDKWKHCIHVFSNGGEYLRAFCSKGNGDGRIRSPEGLAIGPNDELYICDTGNDRIAVINPISGEQLSTIGLANGKTILNMPTGVAVCGGKVVVADTGNHRIKIFNLQGDKLHEFGSLGRNRGQFRSAEVVAVDPLGFIVVGDAGNARIQVFKPDGTLLKIIGGFKHGGFSWISGIFITGDLDIIVTDSKSRSLKIL